MREEVFKKPWQLELCKKNVTRTVDEEGNEKFTVRRLGKLRRRPFYAFIKRLADFVLALIGLSVCLVPMLIIALIVAIDSRGGVIYAQRRVGRGGREFTLYKFRSMVQDAERDGAVWASENDDRTTRVGRFLRKTRLDELPQLINILVGQMSIVGPRPERACFYEEFSTYIDGFEQRYLVTPGLTGWAQVNGGYDLKPEEKIVYDIDYIERRSVWMDITCILRTVSVIFSHEGAR